MKQAEKLDLILRHVYNHRFDGKYYSISWICGYLNIPIANTIEIKLLGNRLKDDGYVKTITTRNDINIELTTYGIDYCEENSYSYTGHPIITNTYNLSITNSPNANIVSSSQNVTIQIENVDAIKEKIEQLRKYIHKTTEIDFDLKENLIECLQEIGINIDGGKKPKFSFKQFLEMGSNISGISTLGIELGKLIFGK